MNCPSHGTQLTRIGNSSYACHQCRDPWVIYADTSARSTINHRAPFAQLVIDADRILSRNIRQPQGSTT